MREPKTESFSVPLRRTRWTSFRIGVGAVIVAALCAATLVGLFAGLLASLKVTADGFWIIFLFGLCWFGLFFLSYPLQRRLARSRDLRRPGINFSSGVLSVPLPDDSTLRFNLDEPHELLFGWCEQVMTSAGGATTNSRAVWTHATLSQGARHLYLIAEDSIREAQSAAWPKATMRESPATPRASLWAGDLVALCEVIRAHPRRAASSPGQIIAPPV